jgi:hypothetical protein
MSQFETDRENQAVGPDDDGEEIVEVDADLLYDAWRDRQMEDERGN